MQHVYKAAASSSVLFNFAFSQRRAVTAWCKIYGPRNLSALRTIAYRPAQLTTCCIQSTIGLRINTHMYTKDVAMCMRACVRVCVLAHAEKVTVFPVYVMN